MISSNDWDGISLIGGINNAVRSNVIRFNGRHGIAVSDGHDTIAGNVIFSNANDGIEVFGASASRTADWASTWSAAPRTPRR